MSKVTHSTVNPGDTNDRAVLNTVFTSWNAQTAVVNEENVAPQAIDRINVDFATNIFHKAVQATFDGATTITATSYANTPTSVGGSAVRLNFSLTSHQATSRIARCSFQVTSSSTHANDYIGLQARLLKSTNGVSYSHIADTERDLKSAITGRELRGNILLIGLVDSDTTYVAVEFIETTTGGGTSAVDVEDVVLYIDGYN